MLANSFTLEGVTYERFQEYPDRSVYSADGHTAVRPRLLAFSRVLPATDSSAVKSRVKHSFTIRDTVTGKSGVITITTDVAYPQWASETDVTAEIAKHRAVVADAMFANLAAKQII